MAEGARLESVYTETYRGFESLPHRHIPESLAAMLGFRRFSAKKTKRKYQKTYL